MIGFGTQVASIVFAAVVFLLVFEMVRRRHLRERYALMWLGAALVLLVLAAWTQLLRELASVAGIKTPSNAFFVIAFAFLLLLLLHFSSVVSRMSDETRILAQRLALLEQRIESAEHGAREHEGDVLRAEHDGETGDRGTRARPHARSAP